MEKKPEIEDPEKKKKKEEKVRYHFLTIISFRLRIYIYIYCFSQICCSGSTFPAGYQWSRSLMGDVVCLFFFFFCRLLQAI